LPTVPLQLQYQQKVYRLLSRWFNIRSRKKLEEICNMRFSFRLAVLLLACCSLRPAFANDAIVADERAAEALVAIQGRIAFKINRTAAQANSLTVSSKLLKLALQIY